MTAQFLHEGFGDKTVVAQREEDSAELVVQLRVQVTKL